jgi:hypothetical protein
MIEPYLFCMESESVDHLFFKCCVAHCIWETVAEIMGVAVVRDFESLARWWIRGENIMLSIFFKLLFCGLCGKRQIISVFREKDGELCK